MDAAQLNVAYRNRGLRDGSRLPHAKSRAEQSEEPSDSGISGRREERTARRWVSVASNSAIWVGSPEAAPSSATARSTGTKATTGSASFPRPAPEPVRAQPGYAARPRPQGVIDPLAPSDLGLSCSRWYAQPSSRGVRPILTSENGPSSGTRNNDEAGFPRGGAGGCFRQ